MADIETLERRLEAARAAIQKGGSKAGQQAENRYGSVYEELVRLGARPRLKVRYRGKS